jgi:hypothetical protein
MNIFYLMMDNYRIIFLFCQYIENKILLKYFFRELYYMLFAFCMMTEAAN